MATPTTKATFKSYCLRALGDGVVDINVFDDQLDDRVDEALQYFATYHYDGIERMYLKHLITTAEVSRARDNSSTTGTDTVDTDITATWKEGTNIIPKPRAVISVLNVFNETPSLDTKQWFSESYSNIVYSGVSPNPKITLMCKKKIHKIAL